MLSYNRYLKFIFFIYISNFFFLNVVYTTGSPASIGSPVSTGFLELPDELHEKVSNLYDKIENTFDTYDANIAKAGELLQDARKILEKIKFVEAVDSVNDVDDGSDDGNAGSDDSSSETTFTMNEDEFPSWVKVAILTSPGIKVIQEKNSSNICYHAFLVEDETVQKYLLEEGDHNLWIHEDQLCGYDGKSYFFIQKYTGERNCAQAIEKIRLIEGMNSDINENSSFDSSSDLQVDSSLIDETVSPHESEISENAFPLWVEDAIVSSPNLEIIEKDQGCYYVFDPEDPILKKFLLKKGDHNLWMYENQLCGYNSNGYYFVQKSTGERNCAG
ncbi:hypothetical protein JKY79_01640 [Candidatus Babeliales bacterium]|nr:hypothetical protein [Candidatus Babeliales bacterium]